MFTKAEKGSRKLAAQREALLILLAAFLVSAFARVETQLFATFITGMAGVHGMFVWGNAKEHASTTPQAAGSPV